MRCASLDIADRKDSIHRPHSRYSSRRHTTSLRAKDLRIRTSTRCIETVGVLQQLLDVRLEMCVDGQSWNETCLLECAHRRPYYCVPLPCAPSFVPDVHHCDGRHFLMVSLPV